MAYKVGSYRNNVTAYPVGRTARLVHPAATIEGTAIELTIDLENTADGATT